MTVYYIGFGDSPGNELLSAAGSANMVGNFIRPVVTDRLIAAGTFLEWFAETPSGGGEFGEGPPHNPRVRGVSVLTGSLPQVGAATNFPQINAVASVTGNFIVEAVISNAEISAVGQLSGTGKLDLFLQGDVTASAFLLGGLSITLFPELDPDILAAVTGVRPCFPALIYRDNVSHVGNLYAPDGSTPRIELYQAFRMSATYDAPPGDQLAAFGARPGSIGMRVMADLDGNGVEEEAILFRRPERNEVVALIVDGSVERWDAELEEWLPFRTMPQRALDGVRAFEILDPQGIYDYYARIVGLKYAALARDTRLILDFIDPDLCPIEFLPLLAANFGADVAADQPEATQREILRNWIPLMRIKGLPDAVVVALRQLGFRGYATQVWTRKGALPTEIEERPFGYSNEFPDGSDPLALHPSPAVIIHLNDLDGSPLVVIDDTTKQVVANFLKLNVLPAHVYIRGFASDIPVGDDTVTSTDAMVPIADVRVAVVAVQAGPATTSFVVSILPVRATIAAQAGIATTAISGEVIAP